MQWKPHVTVAAVIERDGRFLLVEEDIDGRRVYNQPAGHLEAGESLPEAVIREAREETGRSFTPEYLVGVYLLAAAGGDDSDNAAPDNTYLRFCFSGACGERDAAAALDEGIVRAVWMGRDELAALSSEQSERLRTRLVLECIDDYLAGKRYPLDLLRYSHAAAAPE